MSNEDYSEDEEFAGEEPPESLDNLTDELIMYAKDHDEELVAEWDYDKLVFIITSDDLDPVEVFVGDIPDDMYQEAEAVFVEAVIGDFTPDIDMAELLRYCDAELVYGRISLTRGEEDGPELLLMQAACPLSQISKEMLDAMIREVAYCSSEARQFLPTSDEEPEE